jgi:hypothetical protein
MASLTDAAWYAPIAAWLVVVITVGLRHARRWKNEESPAGRLQTLEQARAWLAVNTRRKPRAFSTFDFGRDQDRTNVSVVVPARKAGALLAKLRQHLDVGLVAFIGTGRWLGKEQHRGVELVVAPGRSQMDILRVARTDAVNYGMETEAVVARLTDFDQRYCIRIDQAETDTVQFSLDTLPADIRAFAAELYEFCPDIVDQGVGTVEALAEDVAKHRRVQLWWD